MIAIVIFSLLLFAFAVLFMRERIRGYSKKDLILKTIAAICCVVVGVCAYVLHPTPLGAALLLGGATGAVGDISLGLSHVQKEKRHAFTKGGFLFFGLGHLVYIGGLLSAYLSSAIYWLLPLLIGIGIGAGMGMFGRRFGLHFGRYLPFVIYYVSVLTSGVGIALGLNLMSGFSNPQLRLFLVGMILFMISDSILSRTYFSKGGKSPAAVIANHVTYYGAQYLIAVSILFV